VTAITWTLEADFDRSGSYETDLTPYCDTADSSVRVSRGRNRNKEAMVSSLAVTLSNDDGAFTPENTASPFYGLLQPEVPVRLLATHSAVEYAIFAGYSMRWTTKFFAEAHSVCELECEDIQRVLMEGSPIHVTVSEARDTDAALIAIMDAVGLTAADRDFDDGVQDLPLHFVLGQTPLEAMQEVESSEMGGRLYPTADGKLRFESRSYRLGIAPDQTWGAGTSILPVGETYDLNPIEVYTSAMVRMTTFRTGQADVEVFRFSRNMLNDTPDSLELTAGAVWEYEFNPQSGTVSITEPVSGVDYTANTAANGSGTDRTANLEVTVTDRGAGKFRLRLKNTHASPIFVTMFRLRGQPVSFFADRPEAFFELGVPGIRAGMPLEFDVPFAGDGGQKGRDYAYSELRIGRYAWPTLTLPFRALNDPEIAALLLVDLGDQVLYASPPVDLFQNARVNDWWYVEGLDYNVPAGWAADVFELTVRLVPSYVFRNLDAIAFDAFDRADATGDLGTSTSGDVWANDAGFNIVSNRAEPNTAFPEKANLNLGTGVVDQVAEVSLSGMAAGASNEQCGVVLRYVDEANHYRVYVDDQFNVVALVKRVAGVNTVIADPAWTPTATAELRAIVQGSRLRVWLDRRLVIDETDAALSAGTKVGLYANNAAGTEFSNFYGQGL
jgi:hypothetical protein